MKVHIQMRIRSDCHVGSEAAPKENGAITPEMKALSKTFSRNHAMSIHFNLLTIGGMVLYGLKLASKMNFNV